MRPAGILFVAAVLSSVACHGERAEARRGEAGRVTHATEALRWAPHDGKRPFLEALKGLECSGSDLCALKKTCTDAYTLLVEIEDELGAVRRATADARAPAPRAAALLAETEAKLHRSAELARRCADAEAVVRSRYGL